MRRFAVTAAVLGGVLTAGALPASAAQFTLNVSVVGKGLVNGPGIQCPSTCTGSYPQGTSVVLTAVPGPGMRFAGWHGVCAGTAPQCVVAMNANKTVMATFTP